MKIHILFEFIDGPWGGGNQFLKALRNEFISLDAYTDDIRKADIILFNSYPFRHLEYFDQIIDIKKHNKNILIFHRLDGPISIVRGNDFEIDETIFSFNELFSDGTIFQSSWIKTESEKLGLKINDNYTIIINAPDKSIFYKTNIELPKNEKIKLIATSWSGNIRKGFDVYEWLDNNLDFSKYTMTFVGNSPIEFKNIIHKQPLSSVDLATELKQHHIYISASKHEPCSNALIEAMHCGLPAIAYDNGGNPDIIGSGGELFFHNEEIPTKLEIIVKNYKKYQSKITLPDITRVALLYYNFMKRIFDKIKHNQYNPKVVEKKAIDDFNNFLIDKKLNTKIQLAKKIKSSMKILLNKFFGGNNG